MITKILPAEEILNQEIRFKLVLNPREKDTILNAMATFGKQIIENINNVTNIQELLKIKNN